MFGTKGNMVVETVNIICWFKINIPIKQNLAKLSERFSDIFRLKKNLKTIMYTLSFTTTSASYFYDYYYCYYYY